MRAWGRGKCNFFDDNFVEGDVKEIFFGEAGRGGGLDENRVFNFWMSGSEILEIAIINFPSRLLVDVLFSC